MEWIIGIVLVVGVWWYWKSLEVLGPDFMATREMWGEIKEVKVGGTAFVPKLPTPLGSKITKYPRGWQTIDLGEINVETTSGLYPNSEPCPKEKVTVRAQLLYRYPNRRAIPKRPGVDNLIVVRENGIIPGSKELQKTLIDPLTASAIELLNDVCATKTVWQLQHESSKVEADTDAFLRNQTATTIPFLYSLGFHEDDIRFVVKGTTRAPQVEAGVARRAIAEAAVLAADKEAEVDAKKLMGRVLYMMAISHRTDIDSITQEIAKNPDRQQEFSTLSREMGLDILAAEHGGLLRIRRDGAAAGDLLDVAALLKGIGGGQAKSATPTPAPQEKKEKTAQERAREAYLESQKGR